MDLFDLIGAGINLYGGIKSANAAEDAAESQKRALTTVAENFRPYAELGDYSAGQLQSQLTPNALLSDFSPADLENDPGYQFELAEGNRAIGNAAGARGGRYSGGTLKALQRFGQGLAASRYNQAFQRDNVNKTRNYNMLAGGVSAGQGAQGTVGNFLSGAGDARAAGTVGSNNALWDGVGKAYDVLADARYSRVAR